MKATNPSVPRVSRSSVKETRSDRGIIIGLALLILCAYPSIAPKLSDARGGHTVFFHLSYCLLMLGIILLGVKRPYTLRVTSGVLKRHRCLSALLFVNIVLGIVLVINVFTKFGVLTLILLSAIALFRISSLSRERLVLAANKLLRISPLSIAVIYVLLVSGEIYLRFNPYLVGGGNPALRQIYDALYSKNELGLRGEAISTSPQTGTTRILMVGDSFTFGQGVADDQTLPKYLESSLNEGPDRYEVVNGGRSATDMVDHVRFTREVGLRLEPQLIIVQFYLNDLEARTDEAAADGMLETVLTQAARRSYVLFALRYRFDALMDRVAAEQSSSSPAEHWVAGLASQINDNGHGWSSFCESIDAFVALSHDCDVPICFVLYPHPGLDLAEVRDVHRLVGRRIEAAGLEVIDLFDLVSQLDPSEQIVSEIDHHPSAAMHQLAADRIARSLRGWRRQPSASKILTKTTIPQIK